MGESNTSASTGHRQHSLTGETLSTSVSGASSPSQSECVTNAATSENENRCDDHNQVHHDPPSTSEDDAKASWESGILDSSSTSFVTIKFLVSNNMAGSIIGRSGETISELQQQSSSRIKLGQSGDYYPGTSERACLVHGSLDNVKKAAKLVIQKLFELQLQQVESQLGHHVSPNPEALKDDEDSVTEGKSEGMKSEDDFSTKMSFSVRLLIPSSSCGMLIGRNGSNIKKMKETTHVTSIRLTSKEPDHSTSGMHFASESMAMAATSERILTITGVELDTCIMCAFLILEGFARHPDICRYANNTTSYTKIASSLQGNYSSSPIGYRVRSSPGRGMTTFPQTRGSRTSSSYHVVQPLHNLQRVQRSTGEERRRDHQQQIYQTSPLGESRLGSHTSSYLQSPVHSSGSQESHQQLMSVKISISDTMVGAILGKRGQTLIDLESQSGTKIKISQRGQFIPGTNNRIVTISGPNDDSITLAKSLIRQQLARSAQQDRIISKS